MDDKAISPDYEVSGVSSSDVSNSNRAAAVPATPALATKSVASETRRGMFSAMRHRNFRLFWSGAFVSNIGNWMQTVGLNWLVLSLTNSPFLLGLVNFLSNAPLLLLGMFGGVLADRRSRKSILFITQFSLLTLVMVLAVLTWLGVVEIWMVLLISLLMGIAMAFNSPAYQTIMLDLVGKEDLMNAIALNSMQFNLTRFIGPTIAGALVVAVGVGACFFFNSLSFLAVIVALLLIKLPPVKPKAEKRSVLGDIKEGFGYLRGQPGLLVLVMMAAAFSIFIFPYNTLLSVFAKDIFHSGAASYGALLAAVGLGASCGALVVAKLSQTIKRRSPVLLVGQGVVTVGLIVFALVSANTGNLLAGLALLPFLGAAMVVSLATSNSIVQGNVPTELRGRIISIYTIASMGMMPLGSLQAGFVAEHWGAPTSVIAGAIIFGLITIAGWVFVPQVREL